MANDVELMDSPTGRLTAGGNEVVLESKVDDPVKYRGAAPTDGAYVILSGSFLDPGGVMREVGFIDIKMDETTRDKNRADGGSRTAGEMNLLLKKEVPGAEGDGMIHIMTATTNGIIFHVPVTMADGSVFNPGTGGGSTPPPTTSSGSELISSDGRYLAIMQGDGNFVVYRRDTMQPLWDKFSYEAANGAPAAVPMPSTPPPSGVPGPIEDTSGVLVDGEGHINRNHPTYLALVSASAGKFHDMQVRVEQATGEFITEGADGEGTPDHIRAVEEILNIDVWVMRNPDPFVRLDMIIAEKYEPYYMERAE